MMIIGIDLGIGRRQESEKAEEMDLAFISPLRRSPFRSGLLEPVARAPSNPIPIFRYGASASNVTNSYGILRPLKAHHISLRRTISKRKVESSCTPLAWRLSQSLAAKLHVYRVPASSKRMPVGDYYSDD